MNYLDELNLKQKEAVIHGGGYTFVVSGAGCGKTRTLTNRIKYLIDLGVNEYSIYAFTFTNRAANEMKFKLESLLGRKTDVSLMTFHSYALKILKGCKDVDGYQENFTLIDESDRRKIISDIMKNIDAPIDEAVVLREITLIKNKSDNLIQDENKTLIVQKVLREYQKELIKSNRMDFDDLLLNLLYMLDKHYVRFESLIRNTKYLLVDEAQDINKVQYEIIQRLSSINKNVFMVGDDDQCIYSFRGSNMDCINDFIVNKKAKVIKLEENYRSTSTILEAANEVIKNNSKRNKKELHSNIVDKNFKIVVSKHLSDTKEAVYITDLIKHLISNEYNFKDICILYRNNFISNVIERELLKRNISYYIFGGIPFFERKEIKLIINYIRFFINHEDDIALKEIINTPARLIGDKIQQKIYDCAKENNCSIYKALFNFKDRYDSVAKFICMCEAFDYKIRVIPPGMFVKELLNTVGIFNLFRNETNSKSKINNIYTFLEMMNNLENSMNYKELYADFLNSLTLESLTEEDKSKGKVKLMTIHQAKGLEWNVVILAGLNDEILPSKKVLEKDIEEERRLFYVAITRAKERLYLLSSRYRFYNGKIKEFMESPFLSEIKKDLIIID